MTARELPTVGESQAERVERLLNKQAAQAAEYVKRSGLCAVCQRRPVLHGVTCGESGCMTRWLFPLGRPAGE